MAPQAINNLGPIPNHSERGLPGYQPVIVKKVWKNITPKFHFEYLVTQVPKSLYHIQGSESAKKI